VPGTHRVNLHARYGEFGGKFVDRDQIEPEHFAGWVKWAKKLGIGLDFNGTFFSHPLANAGFTLSSKDPAVRKFWIEHAKRVRKIAAWIGSQLGTPCVLDTWIPDGAKDLTVDKYGYRRILKESLDEIFSISYPASQLGDAVETKLFGIGSESFVVGSHEFYMNYAARNNKLLCIDMGHFHPEEDISDKLSSILLFQDEILLHVSRALRWDSDHVVTWDDELQNIMNEMVLNEYTERIHIGLDYFDASINRLACWVIGSRNVRKALLKAALTPITAMRSAEASGDYTSRLALIEENKSLPFAPVWDYYCLASGAPVGASWLQGIKLYERSVLANR